MAKIKKYKVYTFRHLRYVECLENTVSDEELKNKLLEDCFTRGYIPMDIKFYTKDNNFNKIRMCHCICAYAGKKQARIIGEQHYTYGEKIKCQIK